MVRKSENKEAEMPEVLNAEPEESKSVKRLPKRGEVISWEPQSGILVYKYEGTIYQTNAVNYDGSGFINII